MNIRIQVGIRSMRYFKT